jgi:hypothetical protein
MAMALACITHQGQHFQPLLCSVSVNFFASVLASLHVLTIMCLFFYSGIIAYNYSKRPKTLPKSKIMYFQG